MKGKGQIHIVCCPFSLYNDKNTKITRHCNMGRRQKGLHFYKKRRVINYTLLKEIAGWVFSILVSVLLGAVFVFAFGLKTSVIGVSMEPGLYNGQQILINRFLYQLSEPKAGDVIVFLPNENQNSHYYVKRIVAVPGDRIKILDGKVYVNDEECLLQEYDKIADPGIAQNEIRLNKEEYFVLGDNINNSEDSRSGSIGIVTRKSIIGKVWFKMASKNSGLGLIE